MEIPEWINKDVFEKALISYHHDESIRILNFTYKSANPTGENYTTDVFRATINYTKKSSHNGYVYTTSIIVKCTHKGGLLESLAKEINLFDKEVDMFSNVLPKMNELHREFGTFSAGCLKYIADPLPSLLLEDLCPMGYNVHERRYGLDLEHTLSVLRKLASFHATSVIMRDKNPNVLSKIYDEGLFPDKAVCTGWMIVGYRSLKDAVNRWPECSKYRRLFNICDEEFVERCLASLSIGKDDFVVINHGDMWINNMMFTYDVNHRIEDCKLIDYQLSVLASPAIDLHYFFATSLADEIRDDLDYLLDYYYSHFLVVLTELHYSLSIIPTRNSFLEDFKRRAYYGLLATATVLPLVRAENREDAGFEDLFANDKDTGFRYHAYNNDYYKSAIMYLLPYYASLDVFAS